MLKKKIEGGDGKYPFPKGGDSPLQQISPPLEKGGRGDFSPVHILLFVIISIFLNNFSYASDALELNVHSSVHDKNEQIVFEWPTISGAGEFLTTVPYSLDVEGDVVTITFMQMSNLQREKLQKSLPVDISLSSLFVSAKETRIEMMLPKLATIQHHADGMKVTIDIQRSSNSRAAIAEKSPSKKNKKEDAKVVSLSPKKQEKEQSQSKIFSLGFSWDRPVAAAAFTRVGHFWLVFDRPREVEISGLRRMGGDAIVSAEQIPNKEFTILRMVIKQGFFPSVRKEGLLWVLDLTDYHIPVKQHIEVIRSSSASGGYVFSMLVADGGSIVNITDPEIGDEIRTIAVLPVSAGISPGLDNPDIGLLETVQGIAVLPHTDGIDLRTSRSGITVTGQNGRGLRLSGGNVSAAKFLAQDSKKGLFRPSNWRRYGESNKFDDNRRLVLAELQDAPRSARGNAHLNAARFFFANGYIAEAIGYLRMIVSEDPILGETASVKSLRGICELVIGHPDIAMQNLDAPVLDDEKEIQFWRVAAHVISGSPPTEYDKILGKGVNKLLEYPDQVKWIMGNLVATTAIAAGNDAVAQEALNILDRNNEMSDSGMAELTYHHGQYDEMTGKLNRAIQKYEVAARSNNREFRAKAMLSLININYKLHKITAKEAADKIDNMRFAWREADFELGLLRRYASLLRETDDYLGALRALRPLVDYYPESHKNEIFVKELHEIFDSIYLGGGMDSMSPIAAIALYDEFQYLAPIGPHGDEIVRKLADRLASVDLLDRAADLLKHQVKFRLHGLEKTRVGTQLAVLGLLDKNASTALDALRESAASDIPEDLKRQRRYLEAQALSDLGRGSEAISVLQEEKTRDADLLRADIYWHQKDWNNVSAVLGAIVPIPGRNVTLDAVSSGIIMRWATALVFANDEQGLVSLRNNYAEGMAKTSDYEGFVLLTSSLEKGTQNIGQITSKIKEMENFQTVMETYRQRAKAGELSNIN